MFMFSRPLFVHTLFGIGGRCMRAKRSGQAAKIRRRRWTAMWNGKYLINESGELTGDYISVEQLKKFYNHEATVTRDEIGKQEE